MGAAIVSTELAQKAGFNDKSYAADASYFEAVSKAKKQSGKKLSVLKIPRVYLFITEHKKTLIKDCSYD